MKKINIAEGIKSSLAELINKSQDVWFDNYGELVTKMFSPGFFLTKKTDGTYEDDFKPSITTESGNNIIQVSINGRNPGYCYVAGGKILSLNDIVKIDPRDIAGYYFYNSTESVSATPTTYELWVVPQIAEQDPVDYLPQYKINGETKNLIKNYLVGFLLVKKNSNPPNVVIDPAGVDTRGTTPVTTIRNIPSTIEGLKLAEFTYTESTTTITNLVDLRNLTRAYLQPSLYDFFDSLFLKHDFILTHAEDSSGQNVLAFNKNGTGNPLLTGRFLLVGAKERILAYLSKITVTAASVQVPLNSVLYIEVTNADYYSQTNLTKTLQVQSITDFTPTRDKLVLGYHIRTYLQDGNTQTLPDTGLDVVDPDPLVTTTVNNETSTIYFVNGLPPLPPGQTISRVGIASYILTKDEASQSYYNKTKSDSRFIKTGNDETVGTQYHNTQVYMKYDETGEPNEKYVGVKFLGDVVPFNKRVGFAIVNSDEVPIASFNRVSVDANNRYIELILANDIGTGITAIRLNQNGEVSIQGANPTPTHPNDFVTVAHGVLNTGDDLRGDFNFGVGKLSFFQPDSGYSPSIDDSAPSDSIPNTVLAFEILFDTLSDVVIDLHTHIITGLKAPRTGSPGEKDATNRKYVDDADNLKYDKTGGTITGDVAITGAETVGGTLGVTGKTTVNTIEIDGDAIITSGSTKYKLVSLLKESRTKQIFLS